MADQVEPTMTEQGLTWPERLRRSEELARQADQEFARNAPRRKARAS